VAWQYRQPAFGKDAIEAHIADSFAFTPGDTGTFGAERIDVAASGDLAVEHGTWQDPESSGRYITVYHKVGDEWKIAADMSINTSANGGAPAWATEMLASWYKAFNARDAEFLANSFYAPDARIRDAKGSKAIAALFKANWAETNAECSGAFDAFRADGALAVGWGRDTCTVTPADGGPATTQRSTWVAVYEQQPDGSWLCSRDDFTEIK
jgi:ketosteroid isomerase-like protein